ncbi:MAG TPA: hypothetical protein VIW24_15185 [Aldersonia sp.]
MTTSRPQLDTSSPTTTSSGRTGLPQPWLGLAGSLVIVAYWAVVMLAPGPQRMLEITGAWSIFALPVLGVLALWWNGWPVARWHPAAAGTVLTLATIVGGAAACLLGQGVVGRFDPAHLFGAPDEAALGHLVSFPFTAPLAACVFVVFLQLTFVCRKWPLDRLGPVAGGIGAFAASWVLGTAAYYLLATWEPTVPAPARAGLGLHNPIGAVNALDLMAILLCIAAWQMVVFFLLDGHPVAKLRSTPVYLVVANTTTLAGGVLTWIVLHNIAGQPGTRIGELCAVIITGTLVTGLLFEQWPARRATHDALRRWALLATTAVVAAVTGIALHTIGTATEPGPANPSNCGSPSAH